PWNVRDGADLTHAERNLRGEADLRDRRGAATEEHARERTINEAVALEVDARQPGSEGADRDEDAGQHDLPAGTAWVVDEGQGGDRPDEHVEHRNCPQTREPGPNLP